MDVRKLRTFTLPQLPILSSSSSSPPNYIRENRIFEIKHIIHVDSPEQVIRFRSAYFMMH